MRTLKRAISVTTAADAYGEERCGKMGERRREAARGDGGGVLSPSPPRSKP